MTVIILECVPQGLRSEISKWVIEINTGVFVGKINAVIRGKLWDKIINKSGKGTAYMIWNTNNEQGFDIITNNPKKYHPVDLDGLKLIQIK